MMPRSLGIAVTGFSVIAILVLPTLMMLSGRTPQAVAADELTEGSAAPAAIGPPDSAVATGAAYDRSLSGIDRMMLPPGWSVSPEGTSAAPHPAAERPPASAWKEIGGEIPAGWTGAGSLAGSSAPPPRFAPAGPGSANGDGDGRLSRFSLPSAASGR
jgi:hypothetical protein